jgi:hypothetical protein
MKLRISVFVLLALAGFFVGCKEKVERVPCNGTSPTWDGQVLDIVATSCWGSTCHGVNSSRGDYTSYNNISLVLQSGAFEVQVLETRQMPQDGTLPDSILATLQCWAENGFPEN